MTPSIGVNTKLTFEQAMNQIDSNLANLTAQNNSIINKDNDPLRIGLLTKPAQSFSQYESNVFASNPDVVKDKDTLSNNLSIIDRLKQKRSQLESQAEQLFWWALWAAQSVVNKVESQTPQLLKWVATEEARQLGSVAWATSRVWWTQAMQAAAEEEIRQKWMAARDKVTADQDQRVANALSNLQNTLFNLGQIKLQQWTLAMQEANAEQARLDAQKRTTWGGWGLSVDAINQLLSNQTIPTKLPVK